MKIATLIIAVMMSIHLIGAETQPMIVPQLIEKAKSNTDWKVAVATAKNEQVVFMNISPLTNPNNEIGVEVHPFDQVILIIQGEGKAILNGTAYIVREGDMILIPEGTSHNVVNLGKNKELKIISFYSSNDMPKGAAYKRRMDDPENK